MRYIAFVSKLIVEAGIPIPSLRRCFSIPGAKTDIATVGVGLMREFSSTGQV